MVLRAIEPGEPIPEADPPEPGRLRYTAPGIYIDLVQEQSFLTPVAISVSQELARDPDNLVRALSRIFPLCEIRVQGGRRVT